jgi:hypothetical protein
MVSQTFNQDLLKIVTGAVKDAPETIMPAIDAAARELAKHEKTDVKVASTKVFNNLMFGLGISGGLERKEQIRVLRKKRPDIARALTH